MMKRYRWRSARLGAVLALGLVALPTVPATAQAADPPPPRGWVYTSSNDPAGNEVLAFSVDRDGQLAPAGRYATGGAGSGAGLGSQGSVVLSPDGERLFTVNAGSDEISMFRVQGDRLSLLETVASGGDAPTSVAVHGPLVYVMNNGDDTISGFRIRGARLAPIDGSTRSFSSPADGGQISFTPSGDRLVVTHKDTNNIDVYRLDPRGRPGAPVANATVGSVPFGFGFGRGGQLVVSNAGGGPNASTAASYRVEDGGSLTLLDGPESTLQSAACWVIVSPNGRFAFTTNAGSNSISGFRIGADGDLSLLDVDGVTATTDAGPVDGDFIDSGNLLFVLAGRADAINGFRMGRNGELTPIGSIGGLPLAGAGLAAR